MYTQSKGANPLTPITSKWMHTVMADPSLVKTLMETHGSPINLHHLPSFITNVKGFQELFKKHDLDGQIYFARKANKSRSLVKAALDHGIGVDTASFKELQEAIALGGNDRSLVLTAAIKTPKLMELAIAHHIPVILDNYDELKLARDVAEGLDKKANIGIRLSGFTVNGQKLYSRFGFDIDSEKHQLVEYLGKRSVSRHVQLTGVHFHLDGYSIEQRAEGILQSLTFIRKVENDLSVKISFLDIGGGLLMNYLESKEEWEQFQGALQQAVLQKRSPITFNNNGLGFELDPTGNGIIGYLRTYPYFNQINGPTFLEGILTYTREGDDPVIKQLRNRNIQLRIEPGRSLLNQVGLTIAKVVHRKKDSRNNWLVGLDMNMSQLKSSSTDFLLDPFIIYRHPVDRSQSTEVYLTGAYCLEQDVIIKRKLSFPELPQIGDFVAFINTGGYMMHFYETEAHLFELSKNLYMSNDVLEFEQDDTVPGRVTT